MEDADTSGSYNVAIFVAALLYEKTAILPHPMLWLMMILRERDIL